MENVIGVDLNRASEPKKCLAYDASAMHHDLDKQRLRILRCTAQAMASGPGGLRFRAGTQPWLEGLTGGRQLAWSIHEPSVLAPSVLD